MAAPETAARVGSLLARLARLSPGIEPAVGLGMRGVRVAIEGPPPASSAAHAVVISLDQAGSILTEWTAAVCAAWPRIAELIRHEIRQLIAGGAREVQLDLPHVAMGLADGPADRGRG